MTRVLITGGAGFVGANLALGLAQRDAFEVIVLDNLRRRGAEVNLPRLRDADATFVHGDTTLDSAAYRDEETRFALAEQQELPGVSSRGVAEDFPLDGPRTPYGATKLAAELLVAEYAGGHGKQIPDLLHVDDLTDLITDQRQRPAAWDGLTVNVGGGPGCSSSWRETTALCEELTGNRIGITPVAENRAGDVRIYVSDCTRLYGRTSSRPRRGQRRILEDILAWIRAHERPVRAAVG